MENLNAKEYGHSNTKIEGIVNDKIETLYNIAKQYIRKEKHVEFARLVLEIGLRVADCTVRDCETAIQRLISDNSIIIKGTVNTDDPARYNTTFEYREPKKNGRDDSLPAYIEAIRYLRSKFPNMIIDLEPELPNSTTATASNLVITNKKCPICGELMYVDNGVVLTSNPPQYRFVCKICKHQETGRHDNTVTIGFGKASSEIAGIGITEEYLKNESERTGLHPAEIAIAHIKKI